MRPDLLTMGIASSLYALRGQGARPASASVVVVVGEEVVRVDAAVHAILPDGEGKGMRLPRADASEGGRGWLLKAML